MLPIVFASDPSSLSPDPVVFVDGSPPPGDGRTGDLHLSHWPGNRTPKALKRELSTETAFAFLELDEAERVRLLRNAAALVLNHLDTDGICALFVLVRSEAARKSRELLSEVAAAGDFFAAPSERAVAIDAALRNLSDPNRSAFAREIQSLEVSVRRGRMVEHALDLLGELLVDDGARPELWEPDIERHREDLQQLEKATFDDLVYLDFGVWTARTSTGGSFDPGRHAFLGGGRLDRALLLGVSTEGTTARLVIGTRSFFDRPEGAGSPRPDLDRLVKDLNDAERAVGGGSGEFEWRAQPTATASPELWFGRSGLPLFEERAGDYLAPSRLDPVTIKGKVLDAIRATWALPDDDDEPEDGENIFAV